MPTICSPLSGQFTELGKNQYTHLSNIKLSDCNVNNLDPQTDILIKVDHYWDFMTRKIRRKSENSARVGFKWKISIAKLQSNIC